MITYDTLKEFARALSKITGYRYIAFCETHKNDLFITFSDHEMSWLESKSIPFGVWDGDLDSAVLTIRDLPFLDWFKCQFDCKEKDMDIDFYNGKPFEYHGTHNEVDFWIVSYGNHPCAYVKYDQIESKTYFAEYECHGKITFKGKRIFWTGEEDVVGWDYAHLGLNDYSVHMTVFGDEKTKHLKRWTFREVEKEVFDFIDKYKKQEERG